MKFQWSDPSHTIAHQEIPLAWEALMLEMVFSSQFLAVKSTSLFKHHWKTEKNTLNRQGTHNHQHAKTYKIYDNQTIKPGKSNENYFLIFLQILETILFCNFKTPQATEKVSWNFLCLSVSLCLTSSFSSSNSFSSWTTPFTTLSKIVFWDRKRKGAKQALLPYRATQGWCIIFISKLSSILPFWPDFFFLPLSLMYFLKVERSRRVQSFLYLRSSCVC